MWWGVLCVLVLHFYEELAQLNEESEHDNLGDFIDYEEESESIQPEAQHLRTRRKEDAPGVLTPMSLESNEIEDTTVRPSRSTKLEKEITKDIYTISISEFTVATLKSDLDEDFAKEKEELQSMAAKEDKDIDIKNTIIKFIEDNRGKLVDLASQHAAKIEATSNSIITSADTTTNLPTASEHQDQTKFEFITPLTWSTLNDDFVSNTKSSDTYNSIATEENTKDTLKVITWEVETENTLIDSTVSNEKASTESTTEVITTYDTGIENNFIFPQATVDMSTSATKASYWKDFERRRKKTTTTPKPTLNYSDPNIDIPKLLQILEYVVFDSKDRFNLTKKFNETLQNYTIPTCEPPTPPTEVPTEPPSTMNFNDANVVAKCFVCGLDVERVPYSTACADAFSGDFIPLVPIDPKARGQVAKFRKYCRYLDVNRVITKEDEPHSLFGRFTGGCSVRWVDLTSIYTQRTCRNRRRAVMGKHFGSKRMAKLEMALSDMDNGCIISPVATLLPVSRGISLYARFHACVCTGNWCNKAVVPRNWITNNVLMFIVVTYVN